MSNKYNYLINSGRLWAIQNNKAEYLSSAVVERIFRHRQKRAEAIISNMLPHHKEFFMNFPDGCDLEILYNPSSSPMVYDKNDVVMRLENAQYLHMWILHPIAKRRRELDIIRMYLHISCDFVLCAECY